MKDSDCVNFLQWALPRLHLNWRGFRKVRRQVCKRVRRRMRELDLHSPRGYRRYLDKHVDEWTVLDRLCRITISRFYRDRTVFDFLAGVVLPDLANTAGTRGQTFVSAWSAGCGSGEEPYSLNLVWIFEVQSRFRDVHLRIVATDSDPEVLRRASVGCYAGSSLRELPVRWRDAAFSEWNGRYCLSPSYQQAVTFVEHDIRRGNSNGPFHLVLCRNLAFTYFDADRQRKLAHQLASAVVPAGALVLGAHERLPEDANQFTAWSDAHRIYRRR